MTASKRRGDRECLFLSTWGAFMRNSLGVNSEGCKVRERAIWPSVMLSVLDWCHSRRPRLQTEESESRLQAEGRGSARDLASMLVGPLAAIDPLEAIDSSVHSTVLLEILTSSGLLRDHLA